MTDENTGHFMLLVVALDELLYEPDGYAVRMIVETFNRLTDPMHLRHAVHVCTSSAVHAPTAADPVGLLAALLRGDDTKAAEHLGGVLSAWRGDLVARWDRLEALCPAE
jgi:hypothetical protein